MLITSQTSRVAFRLMSRSALLGFVSVALHPVLALEPSAAAALAQKNRAIQLFAKDSKVKVAVRKVVRRGYKILATDAVPYRFVYGDEGPITNFLVSAWLGKSEAYGWSPAFVMAKVNTDAFGSPKVTLLDPTDVQNFLH